MAKEKWDMNFDDKPQGAKSYTSVITEDTLIDMKNDEYHSHREYLSASQIKDLLDNPYLYFYPQEREETRALVIGSAIHSLILEPENFFNEFAVAPEVNRRTVAGRDEYNDFVDANPDKAVLTKEEYDNCKACADSTLSIPEVQALLMNGVSEKSYFTTRDGIKKKCRPDRWRDDKKVIIDVKSCNDSSVDGFKRDCAKFKYFVQAPYYVDLLGASKFIFLAVEKKPPYMVAFYELSAPDMDLGREFIAKAINTTTKGENYKTPLRKGSDGSLVQTLVLPNYVHYSNEE